MANHEKGEDMRNLGSVEVYELNEVVETGCRECGRTGVIESILKHGGSLTGFHKTKEVGQGTWQPVRDGWMCPECHEDAEVRGGYEQEDEATVEEPPSEWRFCQNCGEKIATSRSGGQFCEDCS
jgi:hypothetical protein